MQAMQCSRATVVLILLVCGLRLSMLAWPVQEQGTDSVVARPLCDPPVAPLRCYVEHAPRVDNANAYVTVVTSPDFVEGALVLMHSISMTNSMHARVAAVTKAISRADIKRLAAVAQVIVIDLVPHNRSIPDERYFDVMTKLRVWELVMFKKVVYLDVDMLVMRNIDDLFDLPELSVMLDASYPRISTGMMVLEPSKDMFNNLTYAFNRSDTHLGLPDLFFLSSFFLERDRDRRSRVNLFSRWHQVYHKAVIAREVSLTDSRVKTLHYPGPDKPWLNFTSRQAKYNTTALRQCGSSILWRYDPYYWWYLHLYWVELLFKTRHCKSSRVLVLRDELLRVTPNPPPDTSFRFWRS